MSYPVRVFDYAQIVNVVDGDTCDIEVDLGFAVKVKHRFRLDGINAPERGQPGADMATKYLLAYLRQPVTLHCTKLDKYGRYLARIHSGSVCLNDEMVATGLAARYTV
jgi:micrococcal nuclease